MEKLKSRQVRASTDAGNSTPRATIYTLLAGREVSKTVTEVLKMRPQAAGKNIYPASAGPVVLQLS